ncbi:GntR family transcriptional regulator [Deefgea rivuli]|uniref:GntR family transcriptional regulator n=1 Tax=Deefgea rivuli TaxID=400948 RepID=UPI0006848043|nr:GntR family transcriptional regulator [Deefgea rivuli]
MNAMAADNRNRKLMALAPDRASPQLIEVQLLQKIKIAISAGFWQPNELLPAVQTLADIFNISAHAVQQVYALLVNDSWIEFTADANYQITPKIDQPVSKLSSLSDLLRARGFKPGSVWLKREVAEPDLIEQWRLNLQVGQTVSRLSRLRTANEQVIGYECSSLPSHFLPDPLSIGNSLYAYMAEHQLIITKAIEEIDAYRCDADMALQCGFQEGQALLRLTRVGYLQNGHALELTYSYFRSDYYRYVVEFND